MSSSKDAPARVKDAFEEIKKKYPFYVALANISSRYYVYRRTSRWDKGKGKAIAVSEYLGRIKDDGTYIKSRESAKNELEKARAVILKYGGTVNVPEKVMQPKWQAEKERKLINADEADKKILMALSMNSRISVPYMSKLMDIKGVNIPHRIRRLERKYGIRYFAVIEPGKLDFVELMAFIKFENNIPSLKEIKDALDKNPHVQFAMLTTGDYDVLIYFLAEKSAIGGTIWELENNAFPNYDTEWHVSVFIRHNGYIPMRGRFLDEVLKNKVWYKNKDSLKAPPEKITQREYAVLHELNLNGKEDFTNIDKKYGFDIGRSQYTYHQLKESKTIYRMTISMQNLPIKYIALLQLSIINREKFRAGRPKLLLNIAEKEPGLINKYALVGDVDHPRGAIFLAPIMEEEQLEKIRSELQKIEGTKLRVTIGRDTIVGSLCFRRYDNAHSTQYQVLREEYKMPVEKERLDYEGTKTTKRRHLDIRGVPI